MKSLATMLLLLIASITICRSQEPRFKVAIYQAGKRIVADKNNTIYLSKAPFQIQLTHLLDEGVLLGATFDADLYRAALGKADLEVSWYENTGMAEELFNPDKAIIQSDEAASYWFYSSQAEHRFDKHPKEVNGRYVGQRTIANFAFLDPYGLVPIAQIQRDLYLVFYESDYNVDKDSFTVLTPVGLHLSWLN